MLTIPKLKKYLVKIINESITQEELSKLEDKYQSDIIEKNIYQNTGWQLLNYVIELLTELNDPKKHPETLTDPEYKYGQIQKIITNELQFKKIGEGVYRNVYSRPDINFVIKLEQFELSQDSNIMISDGANEIEYNTYFNYGTDSRPRNEMFPKIYSYDKQHGMWIIFEKVNTFNKSTSHTSAGDPNIIKIFQPFYNLLLQIFNFIENDTTLQHLKFPGKNNPFKIKTRIKEIFNDPIKQSLNLFDLIFSGIINSILNKLISNPDINAVFEDTLLDYISWEFISYKSRLGFKKECPQEFKILKRKLREYFPNLTPTPDLFYIINFLKISPTPFEDLHIGNLGYRDMKNNPTQPWKNFVIIDFAEFD